MRITPHTGMKIEVGGENGWLALIVPASAPLELEVSDIQIVDVIKEEKGPLPAPAVPSRVNRWKMRVVRMLRSLVALPSAPIPILTLILLGILAGLAYLIGFVLPMRPVKTLTREVFIGQLAICSAIEAAIVGD